MSTTGGSPSQMAGFMSRDQILEVDGTGATPKALNDMLTARKPGDRARLKIVRNGANREIEIVLGENMKRSFQFQPMPNPSVMQSAILQDWLRSAQ